MLFINLRCVDHFAEESQHNLFDVMMFYTIVSSYCINFAIILIFYHIDIIHK